MGASYCDIFPYVYELYFNFVPKKSPPTSSDSAAQELKRCFLVAYFPSSKREGSVKGS